MNFTCLLSPKRWIPGFLLASFLLISANAQVAQNTGAAEQISFSIESPFTKPVTLSQAAMKTLVADRTIATAMKDGQVTIESIPKDWFRATEVQLGPKGESDLLVMGLGILSSRNRAGFWILRPTAQGYEIALATEAHDLSILESTTNGLRDLETGLVARTQGHSDIYQFDGQLYEKIPPAQGDQPSKIPAGEAQFTPDQLKNYYLVYTNPDVKYLRTLFDAYLEGSGGTDEEFELLDKWNRDYFRSKFFVLSRDRGLFGGTLITILFQDRPDRIFVAWVYPEGEEGKLTLRAFDLGNFTDEDIRRTRVRFKALLEDSQHAM
jgi:hypothetical protein